jgi:hypothetical protein
MEKETYKIKNKKPNIALHGIGVQARLPVSLAGERKKRIKISH